MSAKNTIRVLVGWLVFSALSIFGFAAGAVDIRVADAAEARNTEALSSLLKQKADVNAPQPDGATALAWAAHWNDLDTVDLLISAGANVNMANDYGITPLSLACTNKNAAMVDKLLAAGANPNLAQWSGETPLMTCVRTGEVGSVKSLLAKGADVNAKETQRGQTALMWAIAYKRPEIARFLIEHGADVHARAQSKGPSLGKGRYGAASSPAAAAAGKPSAPGGYTPLLFAAQQGDLETTKLLLAEGADVNEAAEDGTALLVASANDFEDLALFLLDHGANPNAKDSNGVTALHYALREGFQYIYGINKEDYIPEKIVQNTAEDLKKSQGKSDLFIQSSTPREVSPVLPGSNMVKLMKALLVRGADANAAFTRPPSGVRGGSPIILAGGTPIMLAAAAGDVNSMRFLLEGKANPLVGTTYREKDAPVGVYKDGSQYQAGSVTPLMLAAGMGRKLDRSPEEQERALDVMKLLVEHGADVNQATETGWTALHSAAFLGDNIIVQFLVEHGAKLDLQNGCGQTPLMLAEGSSARGLTARTRLHQSTAELLFKSGATLTGTAKLSSPAGRCVEGRFGLDDYSYDPFRPGVIAQEKVRADDILGVNHRKLETGAKAEDDAK